MSIAERQESIIPQPNWPDMDVIKDLYTNKDFIRQMSPQWWSVKNTPDPRELMHFDDFMDKLVPLGTCVTGNPGYLEAQPPMKFRDVYLYPEPVVPMSVLTLDIEGQKLPFLVTARPYHEQETDSDPFTPLLDEYPSIDKLQEFNRLGNPLGLYNHFYPHIRGLYAGMRGSNAFWYTLYAQAEEPIKKALQEEGLSFIEVYIDGMGWGSKAKGSSWDELVNKVSDTDFVDLKKLKWPDFEFNFVSAEEFLRDFNVEDQNLIVKYPLAVDGCENLMTLFISNRTHKEAGIRPVVLGIYVRKGKYGFGRETGIARIKDRTMAEEISTKISADFGIEVDTLLFTPQKGRPKYDRVPAVL